MDQQKPSNKRHRSLLVFLFHFLLLSYPLLSLLWRRSYPLITAETGTIFLALAVISLLLTVVFKYLRTSIANGLSLLLITITLMLQFNFLLLGVVVSLSVGLVFAWQSRANFQLYSLPVLLTLILGAYIDSSQDAAQIHSGAVTPTCQL